VVPEDLKQPAADIEGQRPSPRPDVQNSEDGWVGIKLSVVTDKSSDTGGAQTSFILFFNVSGFKASFGRK
jgi:hypothetical protein